MAGITQRGWFLAIEGMDGTGKTTLTERLARHYETSSHAPNGLVQTRNLGGTPMAEELRQVFIQNHDNMPHWLNHRLAALATDQQAYEKVVPALNKGLPVISDRWNASTFVYNGRIRVDNALVSPDFNLWLDIPAEVAIERVSHEDVMDDKPLSVYKDRRDAYKEFFDQEDGDSFARVDASGTPDEVFSAAVEAVDAFLGRWFSDGNAPVRESLRRTTL